MENLSYEKLEQIDKKADVERLKDMSNTELVSFFYDANLRIGECNDLIKITIEELMQRGFDIRYGNNE